MTPKAFIERLGPPAQADMAKTGILASLTLAQAILESGWGESGLAKRGNNLFGIKGSYRGQSITCRTFEYVNGERVEVDAAFRRYPSWEESIADHSALFLGADRYANLRGCLSWQEACANVEADGYATAPGYGKSLMQLIERYGLYRYDRWKVEVRTFTKREEAVNLREALSLLGLYSDVTALPGGGSAVVIQSFTGRERAAGVSEGLRLMKDYYSEVRPLMER